MVGFPERSPCACVWMHVLASVGQRDKSLGRLGAQQSLNSCIDVSTGGNKRLQVGLTINEAHCVQLLQLLLESHFRALRLRGERTKTLEINVQLRRGERRRLSREPELSFRCAEPLQAGLATLPPVSTGLVPALHQVEAALGEDP